MAPRSQLPLNALRAFEASARHLSFTVAAAELNVTQGAISHQVKALEQQLGVRLFRRLPRGLALTEEAQVLAPTLSDSFDRMADLMEQLADGAIREVLTVGVVGAFAVGWLIPRLAAFQEAYPRIDLRLRTNNNKVDLAGDGLDQAIRFGDGAWHGTEAIELFTAPLAPLCTPQLARRLNHPADLLSHTLLRSYRPDEWARWLAGAGVTIRTVRGPMFDSSVAMVAAAMQGAGVALAPPMMFERELLAERLAQPFADEIALGAYWLTWLKSRPPSPAMQAFRDWCLSPAFRQPLSAVETA